MTISYDLTFTSTKGEFALNVESVATLNKSLIPQTYFVATDAVITTTDDAAIDQMTRVLLRSSIGQSGETLNAILVQANGSRWILYGCKEATSRVMVIKARMMSGHALVNVQRRDPAPGQSIFLVKKVRNALDSHQVRSNGKRQRLDSTVDITTEPAAKRKDIASSATKRKSIENSTTKHKSIGISTTKRQSSESSTTKHKSIEISDMPPQQKALVSTELSEFLVSPHEKSRRDKLKKIIITLLSLQSISKSSPTFKDLYQHTLQAASFALTRQRVDEDWDVSAMQTSHALIKLFLGSEYRAS